MIVDHNKSFREKKLTISNGCCAMEWKKYLGFLVLLAVVIIFITVLLIMGAGNLISGDEQLFLALNPPFNPASPTGFDYFFVYFSSWGPGDFGLATWVFIPFAIVLFVASIISSKLRPMRLIFLLVIIGLIIGYLGITTVLKFLIERTRPFVTLESSVDEWVPFFFPSKTVAEMFDNGLQSFPSGHATAGFIFATSFILVYKQTWIRISALVYGVLAAYARPFLGVHYPTDVFVGSLVGILTVWLFFVLLKRYLLPKAPWFQYSQSDDQK